MPINKNAMIRYQALDKCFSNFNRQYFIKDLIEACNEKLLEFTGSGGISRRQIFDDIRFMESSAGWEIELERKRFGKRIYYRYKDPDYSINRQPLTNNEIDQIKLSTFILSRVDGQPEYGWASEMYAKLEDKFNIDGQSSVVMLDSNPYAEGLTHISTIYNAITRHKALHIEYKTFQDKNYSWDIHPYFLREYNNRWFLIALNNLDDRQLLHIALDRIIEIQETDIDYIENNVIDDIQKYFEDVIGVTIPRKGRPETIKLQFSEHRYPYIIAKPIHGSMKIIDKNNRIVSVDVIPNKELESLILSFGNDVEILEPERLRNKIGKILKSISNKYN